MTEVWYGQTEWSKYGAVTRVTDGHSIYHCTMCAYRLAWDSISALTLALQLLCEPREWKRVSWSDGIRAMLDGKAVRDIDGWRYRVRGCEFEAYSPNDPRWSPHVPTAEDHFEVACD